MRKPRGIPRTKPLLAVVTKCNYNETMANITIRNIPDQMFAALKDYAAIERRSLNNEILIALELGVKELRAKKDRGDINIPKDVQLRIWKEIGKGIDDREWEKMKKAIMGSRSRGRDDIRL
jgi:plasmid stability protein